MQSLREYLRYYRLYCFPVVLVKLSTSFVTTSDSHSAGKECKRFFILRTEIPVRVWTCSLIGKARQAGGRRFESYRRVVETEELRSTLASVPVRFYGKVSSLRSSSLRKPIRTSEYQETEATSGSYRRPCGLSTVMARKRFNPLRLKSIFTGYSSALDNLEFRATQNLYSLIFSVLSVSRNSVAHHGI